MSATTYLLIANVIVWSGIAGYLVFLAGRTKALNDRVQRMELLGDNDA